MLLLLKGPGTPEVPTHLLGVYQEIFDFGSIVNNIIVNLSWSVHNVVGEIAIQSLVSTSTDGIAFSGPVNTTSIFVLAVRFVKVRMEFTALDDKSGIKISDFKVTLNIHTENDGGSIAALSTDVSGTRVTFNKSFQYVDSITITPVSNTTVFHAYDNADNTGFNIFVWDGAGTRVSKTVTWAARGVI